MTLALSAAWGVYLNTADETALRDSSDAKLLYFGRAAVGSVKYLGGYPLKGLAQRVGCREDIKYRLVPRHKSLHYTSMYCNGSTTPHYYVAVLTFGWRYLDKLAAHVLKHTDPADKFTISEAAIAITQVAEATVILSTGAYKLKPGHFVHSFLEKVGLTLGSLSVRFLVNCASTLEPGGEAFNSVTGRAASAKVDKATRVAQGVRLSEKRAEAMGKDGRAEIRDWADYLRPEPAAAAVSSFTFGDLQTLSSRLDPPLPHRVMPADTQPTLYPSATTISFFLYDSKLIRDIIAVNCDFPVVTKGKIRLPVSSNDIFKDEAGAWREGRTLRFRGVRGEGGSCAYDSIVLEVYHDESLPGAVTYADYSPQDVGGANTTVAPVIVEGTCSLLRACFGHVGYALEVYIHLLGT